MTLEPEAVKQRIEGARILRGMSQPEMDRRGFEEGYGKGEMSRVERGELPYRAGKHLDVLCRILNVPRWWFTAEDLYFGAIDAPASPDEVSSLLAQQNDLLDKQTELLKEIRAAVSADTAIRDEITDLIDRRRREFVEPDHQAAESDPKPTPEPRAAARKSRAATQRTR